MRCNICGSQEFASQKNTENIRCAACNSLERTRLMFALLERFDLLRHGARCLHIAPEVGLSRRLKDALGDGYEAVDLEPDRYAHAKTKRFDLCKDTFTLPDQHYDLILHNHVLEHIPCNYGAVFVQLRRALKVGGIHIFSVPVMKGRYAEEQGDMRERVRERQFGQKDHMRRFGRDDFNETIGSLVDLTGAGTWDQTFSPAQLTEICIRDGRWASGPKLMIACMRVSENGAMRDELIAPVVAGYALSRPSAVKPVKPRDTYTRFLSALGLAHRA